jgi:hypothetical protein
MNEGGFPFLTGMRDSRWNRRGHGDREVIRDRIANGVNNFLSVPGEYDTWVSRTPY